MSSETLICAYCGLDCHSTTALVQHVCDPIRKALKTAAECLQQMADGTATEADAAVWAEDAWEALKRG